MKKHLLTALALLALLGGNLQAQVTFTYLSGQGKGNAGNEGMEKLFDKNEDGSANTGTKYCGNTGTDVYAIVEASEAVYVWGYDFTTANDNNGNRRVTQWVLSGTNDAAVAADPSAEGWVTLSNLGNNSAVQGENFYTQRFFCDAGTSNFAYKYFKLALTGGGFIQLSDVSFCYETDIPVTYEYVDASNGSFQKAFDGNITTKFEGGSFSDGSWMIVKTADGQPHAVKSYSMTTHDDGSWKDRAPKTWKLEGSNDQTNWVTIDEVTNDPIENKNYKTFEFIPANTTDEFVYVRLTVNNFKGGYHQLAEFHVVSTANVSEYYGNMVTEAKALLESGKAALGETDSWYVEYKNRCDALDAAFAAALVSKDFADVVAKVNSANEVKTMIAPFVDGKKYVAIAGTASWGDGHWSQLVDGKENSKWGGNFDGNVGDANHVQWVIFRTKEAFAPFFYKLVTGGDTKQWNGRNWKSWEVYGANFTAYGTETYDSEAWVLLDKRTDISEKYLPMENNYPATFDFTEGVKEAYGYYMVKVTEAHSGAQIQMSEMYLCTQEEFEDIREPLVAELEEFAGSLSSLTVEADLEDEKVSFQTLYEELKTTADAVRLTEVYNELVALRTTLAASAEFINFASQVEAVDGVYQIGTAAQLALFSKAINNGSHANLSAALTANIDMTGVSMEPIGNDAARYAGTFDGKGFSIANYTYENAEKAESGLFGVTAGATIKNVMLKNARIVGNENIGGIVGRMYGGTAENCAVVGSYVEGRDHVGAIAGEIRDNATVENCYSDADIYSRGYQAGGLAGTSRGGSFLNNLFLGSINCAGGSVAGIVALIDAADNGVQTVIKGNVVAATSFNLGWGDEYFFTLTNINGKNPNISYNYVLTTTKFRNDKTLADLTTIQGLPVKDVKQITCKSFYETLGWNLTDDWKFVAAGQFPVLAYMEAAAPAPQTIIVSEAGYATAVAEKALDFTNAEVEAFLAQVVDGKYVHLEPITIVPAGEAVVVKAAAGSYEIPVAMENGVAENNDLKASAEDVTADGTQYILANSTDGVGFYQATGTIAAGKGYIQIANAEGVKALFFEGDEATGMSEELRMKNEESMGKEIYNLAGQRMSKMQNGINIVGGKKVIF